MEEIHPTPVEFGSFFFPIIFKVLCIPVPAGFLPSAVEPSNLGCTSPFVSVSLYFAIFDKLVTLWSGVSGVKLELDGGAIWLRQVNASRFNIFQ